MTAWIYRCPQGHASVRRYHEEARYRCQSCLVTYEGEPFDARETEFPVEDNETRDLGAVDLDAVLERAVEVANRHERAWVRSDEVDVSAKRGGWALERLERRGYIERRSGSIKTRWRPTAAGRAAVDGGNR